MRYVCLLFILIAFINCKTDKKSDYPITVDDVDPQGKIFLGDTIKLEDSDWETRKAISIENKQKQLIEKKDDQETLEGLVLEKKYVVKRDDYVINFRYPQLNESFNLRYSSFNDFINNYYVNISKTESDILQTKAFCDSIGSIKFREQRLIDYKIYNLNDELISVLFYKENFYSGTLFPSYSFDCFNYNLSTSTFMDFEDFFVEGSEEELIERINTSIKNKIASGEIYYECWEISSEDFMAAKNNFVINDMNVEFYFDDCVICPSYTGTYSIEVSLLELLPVLKKYDTNPLIL
ncbi:RsiV family protein [Tamlana crocina]